MKKHIFASLLILAGVLAIFMVLAQKKETGIIPDKEVKEAIQTFIDLVDSTDVQEFGLKSMAELKLLKPGRQFRNYLIAADDIRKYKTGDDVKKIIAEFPSVEVSLVNAAGTIITSIEFVKNKNEWEAAGFGLTPELIVLRNAQSAIPDTSIGQGSLIRIPALQTSFISLDAVSGLNFIILEDNTSLGFVKGKVLPAAEAIKKLIPLANSYNGLPN